MKLDKWERNNNHEEKFGLGRIGLVPGPTQSVDGPPPHWILKDFELSFGQGNKMKQLSFDGNRENHNFIAI